MPGPLALLLLLATVSMTLRRTDAFSSSSSFCGAEINACIEDQECYECLTDVSKDGDLDDFTQCYTDFADFSDTCSIWTSTPCCYDVVSPNDCMGNSAFVDYMSCFVAESSELAGTEDCTLSSTSCNGFGGGEAVVDDGTDDTDDDAASSAAGDDASSAVVADDDTGGVVGGDDAPGDDAGTTTAADDVTTSSATTGDRAVPVEDDDAEVGTVGDDDAGSTVGVTSSSGSSCNNELFACFDDEECNECTNNVSGEAYSECIADQDVDETDVCAALSLGPCCVDAISSNDCLGNSAFVELWTCALRDQQVADCAEITCDGETFGAEGASATPSGGVVAASLPSVMLAGVLGLAVVAAAPFVTMSL